MRVSRSLSITTEGVTFVPPKLVKGTRSICLTLFTVSVLQGHRADSGNSGGEDLVFGSSTGTLGSPELGETQLQVAPKKG